MQAPPNPPPPLLVNQLNAGLDAEGAGRFNLSDLLGLKGLFQPPDDPLRTAKFWTFAGVAVVVMLVGGWVAVDPLNKHPDDFQSAGLAAAVASVTGLGGLGLR